MNKIEAMFLDAFLEYAGLDDYPEELTAGEVIGPYRVDFCYKNNFTKFAIEIDGHEAHKTKEQRDYDYKRERYLQKLGYIIIRFTGTEVFLDAERCAEETSQIMEEWDMRAIDLNYALHLCIENNLLPESFKKACRWDDIGKSSHD